MSTKINVRSPYYIKRSYTSVPTLNYATLSLYIYEGDLGTDKPASAQYTLTKTELNDGDYVVFEISELVRDYLVTEYGSYSTDVVWVEADITAYAANGSSLGTVSYDYLAFDGYGYFEDGINPELSRQLLQSNTILYYNEGQDIVFPIFAEDLSTITLTSGAGANVNWEAVDDFWNLYDVSWGYALTPIVITDDGNTDQKIQYIRLTNSEELQDDDSITITSGVGGATTVITLEEICEPKFTPLNVIFYNKFGALQNMWFFKKSITTLNTTSENYKSNILDFSSTPTYSTTSPQVQKFNVNGKEVITLNSGFYDEAYNEVVRQLMLSENVWIDNGTDVLPVNVNTSSYTFQTRVNDKLIQHALDFEYAFDKINSVR